MPTSIGIASVAADESNNMLGRRHATSCTVLRKSVCTCDTVWDASNGRRRHLQVCCWWQSVKRYMSDYLLYVYIYTYLYIYIYPRMANIQLIWRHVPANCQTTKKYCVHLCAKPCMRESSNHLYLHFGNLEKIEHIELGTWPPLSLCSLGKNLRLKCNLSLTWLLGQSYRV